MKNDTCVQAELGTSVIWSRSISILTILPLPNSFFCTLLVRGKDRVSLFFQNRETKMSWRLIAKRAANIREIRFLVPNGGAAAANDQGLRDFIAHQHKDLKMLNPSLNLPVREGFEDLSPQLLHPTRMVKKRKNCECRDWMKLV